MITIHEAKGLTNGQTIYHNVHRNSDGTPQRWRVSGMVKTWKRSPDRVKVPIKYGLYSSAYLTEDNLMEFCLTEDRALTLGKVVLHQNGRYMFNVRAKHYFTIYTKDDTCGRSEYAEEIDVACIKRSAGEAKRIARAALEKDYDPGLKISKVEYQY